MAWDSNRPVPWARLMKEWAIYAGIMAAILIIVFRDGGRLLPILGGLIISGPIYLAFGAVLAKFGYQRKTLAELRTPRAEPRGSTDAAEPGARPRPAPTRRTSTGPSNRPRSKKR